MKNSITIIFLLITCLLSAQDFVQRKGDVFILDNGHILRELEFRDSALSSSSLSLTDGERNYIMKSREFAECVDAIDAALKLSAKYAKGYFQRAACRTGLHDQAGAKEDFIRSAQLGDKTSQDLLSKRGIAW